MAKDRILVTRSSMPSLEEYVAEIAPLWESHWLTNMGEKHQEFEKALASYLHLPSEGHIALFTNGHSALECALEAMDLHGKVITTPFSFASTTHAIVRKGLTPVFADIKPDDYTLDPESVERLIDEDTCAIVPVHVYGNLCDVDAFEAIAKRHGVKVIYDAAHAFGVERGGVSAASFGDAAMFSFHATKVFNTIEGGAVCFHDEALKEKLNQWKNFGITGLESVEYVGGNAKMNEFCAAMGLCNLRHLDGEIARRKAVAERYWERLEPLEGVQLCRPKAGIKPNYAYMPVVFWEESGTSRDEVFAELRKHQIYSRKYFYPLISDYECYAGEFDSAATPVARRVAAHVLCLPMFSDLTNDEVDVICDEIVSLCNKQ